MKKAELSFHIFFSFNIILIWTLTSFFGVRAEEQVFINASKEFESALLKRAKATDPVNCLIRSRIQRILVDKKLEVPEQLRVNEKVTPLGNYTQYLKPILDSPLGAKALKSAASMLAKRNLNEKELFEILDEYAYSGESKIFRGFVEEFRSELNRELHNVKGNSDRTKLLNEGEIQQKQVFKSIELLIPLHQESENELIEFMSERLRQLMSDRALFKTWYSEVPIGRKLNQSVFDQVHSINPMYWDTKTDRHYIDELVQDGVLEKDAELALASLKFENFLMSGKLNRALSLATREEYSLSNMVINDLDFQKEILDFEKGISDNTSLIQKGFQTTWNYLVRLLPKNETELVFQKSKLAKKLGLKKSELDTLYGAWIKLNESKSEKNRLMNEYVKKLSEDKKLWSTLKEWKSAQSKEWRLRLLKGKLSSTDSSEICNKLAHLVKLGYITPIFYGAKLFANSLSAGSPTVFDYFWTGVMGTVVSVMTVGMDLDAGKGNSSYTWGLAYGECVKFAGRNL